MGSEKNPLFFVFILSVDKFKLLNLKRCKIMARPHSPVKNMPAGKGRPYGRGGRVKKK